MTEFQVYAHNVEDSDYYSITSSMGTVSIAYKTSSGRAFILANFQIAISDCLSFIIEELICLFFLQKCLSMTLEIPYRKTARHHFQTISID